MTRTTDAGEFELTIRGPSLSAGERAETERLFWFTLGRFENALRRVDVTVSPLDDRTDGWVVCRIGVHHRGGVLDLVEGADGDLTACVRRTFQRAARGVRRRVSPIERRVSADPGRAA